MMTLMDLPLLMVSGHNKYIILYNNKENNSYKPWSTVTPPLKLAIFDLTAF